MRLSKFGLFVILIAAGGLYVWHQEGEPMPGGNRPAGQATQGSAPGGPGGGGRRGGPGGGRGEGPTSVLTAASQFADVPVTLVAVGTAQALNTVTVRTQVDGQLVEIAFREGQDVKKGDVLARIDPSIYQAQYDQAVAKKAQDEANLANSRVDLTRYINLAQTNYGSKQQADTQRAAVAQLEAQVKADQGAIDSAKTYLDYTTIRAPIDGRTGIRQVDQGNLVKTADTTGIVVLTQLKPITVLFNLPQQNLRAVNTAALRGPVPVDALESDNATVLDHGTLEVVDNQVDQTTGTVKLKATFPNAQQQLWPGQFVNVRLTVDTLKHVVTVPTSAVQRGPNGAFVYTVVDEKAALKNVEVGRQDETISVITSGLTPPERVITTGFARLTNGDRVRVADNQANAQPGAGETAAPGAPEQPAGATDGTGREGRRRRSDAAVPATDGTPGEGARQHRRWRENGGSGQPGTGGPGMPGGLPPSPPQGAADTPAPAAPGSTGAPSPNAAGR